MKNINLKLSVVLTIGALLMILSVPAMAQQTGSGIFKLAGNIQIAEGQIIEGDVESIAGNIVIYGVVNGDVISLAGNIRIYGTVNGDVQNTAGNIRVYDDARVDGSIHVQAGNIYQEEGAIVSGTVSEVAGNSEEYHHIISSEGFNLPPRFPMYILIWGIVTTFVGWFAIGILLMLFFAEKNQQLAEKTKKRPGFYFMIGFLTYLIVPPVVVLSAVTIVGIPLVPVILLVTLLGTIFGQLGVARTIGKKVINKFDWKINKELSTVALGMLTIILISLIPILGWLFFFGTACIGIGSGVVNRFGIEWKEGGE